MERSLYERLGGMDSITAVVENFRDRVAADDRINKKFARTDLVRLRKMLIDQVCEATGRPCHYTGRSMKVAHEGMGVTSADFDALVQDCVATFDQFNACQEERSAVLALVAPLKTEIVELTSTTVGTPRPGTYQL